MPVNRKYREVRRGLRKLKREFPSVITLYHLLDQSKNVTNGTVTKSWQRIVIRRAIVLPAREIREFAYDLAFIAANKNFTYGGFYDTALRRFIIDWDDLPGGLMISKNDRIIYEQRRWDVKELSNSAELRFTSPIGEVVDGVPPNELHPVTAEDGVEISETDG